MKQTPNEHNERVIQELIANPELLKNKRWRMDNLYWITNKDGIKMPFTMNRAQLHFFENFLLQSNPYYRHLILKSRQLGFTTFFNIYILDEILFNPNKEGLIIAHKLKDATEIFDRKIDFAVKNIPAEVKDALFKITRNSAKKIQVTTDDVNGSKSQSGLQVDVSGRSNTLQYLHISEFAKLCVAFPKTALEVIRGTFPAVSFDGFIFIESTAEGMSGHFYDMFISEWGKEHQITPMLSRVRYYPHFYNWTWDDTEMVKITDIIPVASMDICEIPWEEYQKEHNLSDREITYYYMKWLQMNKDIHTLRQEFPTTAEEAFVTSGSMYFPTTKVVSMLANVENGKRGELTEYGSFVELSNGDLEVFRQPEKGTNYVIGIDTAEGLAHGDAQVMTVVNCRTEEIDALFKSQIPVEDLNPEAFKLGKYYNNAMICVETNRGDGLWLNNELTKMGYTNLYYRKVFDDITQKHTMYYGWKTTSSTRPFMLAALKAIFAKKTTGFPKALLQEMLKFVRNAKGKPEAMQGEHDDCFVKGTLILTDTGNKPIEEIKIGDLVMTRDGYKPIVNTRKTLKTVINNIALRGTPSHPIILADNSQKELCKITQNDKLHIWNQQNNKIEKLSFIEARNIIATQTHQGDNIGSTIGDTINGKGHQLHYIDKFGLIISEIFLKVLQFIIKTTIHLIILLVILKYYLVQYMQSIICQNVEKKRNVTAKHVKKNLFITQLEKLNSVLINATQYKEGKEYVYNLQVADCHEYFANNILVHNCIMSASIAFAVAQENKQKLEDTRPSHEKGLMSFIFNEQ